MTYSIILISRKDGKCYPGATNLSFRDALDRVGLTDDYVFAALEAKAAREFLMRRGNFVLDSIRVL